MTEHIEACKLPFKSQASSNTDIYMSVRHLALGKKRGDETCPGSLGSSAFH